MVPPSAEMARPWLSWCVSLRQPMLNSCQSVTQQITHSRVRNQRRVGRHTQASPAVVLKCEATHANSRVEHQETASGVKDDRSRCRQSS